MSEILRQLRSLHRSGTLIQSALHRRRIGPTKRIVIDYSSPNIAKPLHLGNMRSTLIGRYIDRTMRAAGHNVISINYIGDWGTQFGLLAHASQQGLLDRQAWQCDDDDRKLNALVDCYVKARNVEKVDHEFRLQAKSIFARMETGDSDPETVQFLAAVRQLGIRHLNQFYRLFDVQFDHWHYESQFVADAHAVVDRLIAAKIVQPTVDGAWMIDAPPSKAILRKSDRSSLYLSRELAAILRRHRDFAADSYIYVVDTAQTRHFLLLKDILRRMGEEELAERVLHVRFGRLVGMSSRDGKVEYAQQLVDKVTQLAGAYLRESPTMDIENKEELDDVARQVTIATIVTEDLRRARVADYTFKFENAFQLNQDNGLFIQAKHARLCGIERVNADLLARIDTDDDTTPSLDSHPDAVQLIEALMRFDDKLSMSTDAMEPNIFIRYLFELAQHAGSATASLRVKDEPDTVGAPRLLLLSTTRMVLADSLRLLGLQPLQRT